MFFISVFLFEFDLIKLGRTKINTAINDIAGINSSKPINQVFQKLLAF